MKRPSRNASVAFRVAIVAAVALLAAAVSPLASQAETIPGASASELAAAISAEAGLIAGAEFLTIPAPGAAAVSTTPLAGFPSGGDSYAVLSTGDAADIELPNDSGSTGTNLGGGAVRGDTDQDVTILRLDFTAPEGANCLIGLDFRFLSEEYPEFVDSEFNDAFIVELDESTWTTSGSEISAPGNIAFDPAGSEISINAAGETSVTAGNALGTTFDGATPLLRASVPLDPGPHSLYLSLFDQGDQDYDSAVQVDNLRVGTVDDVATECTPGAEVAQPTASFTTDPTTGPAPLAVSVDGSASFDPDGTVESYAWDFGNGETAAGLTASTVYNTPGDYDISLTVTDNEGLTDVETQTVTVTEGQAPGGPTVSMGSASGLERDLVTGSVFVPVFLSEANDVPTVVSFYTEDGTATGGEDYRPWGTPDRPRTITIPAGALQGTVNVPVLTDDVVEADETFSVVVSSVSGGDAVIGEDTGTATIVDADAASATNPALTVSNGTVYEGKDGQRRAQFMIHLSRPATDLSITYETAEGTAIAGDDYVTKLPGKVLFAPGQISKVVDVLVNSDTEPGGPVDFVLNVAVTGGSTVEELNMAGTSTILDDD